MRGRAFDQNGYTNFVTRRPWFFLVSGCNRPRSAVKNRSPAGGAITAVDRICNFNRRIAKSKQRHVHFSVLAQAYASLA